MHGLSGDRNIIINISHCDRVIRYKINLSRGLRREILVGVEEAEQGELLDAETVIS